MFNQQTEKQKSIKAKTKEKKNIKQKGVAKKQKEKKQKTRTHTRTKAKQSTNHTKNECVRERLTGSWWLSKWWVSFIRFIIAIIRCVNGVVFEFCHLNF